MHPEARAFVAAMILSHGPFTSVLEVGSRHINGEVRDLFGDCDYHGLDLQPGPGVDEVTDVTTWTTDRRFDAVVCCEVLEHATDPEQVVKACMMLLEPHGLLILTAACDPRDPHSGVDGGEVRPGEHYGNIDPDALLSWLQPTGVVSVWPRGDVYATALKP